MVRASRRTRKMVSKPISKTTRRMIISAFGALVLLLAPFVLSTAADWGWKTPPHLTDRSIKPVNVIPGKNWENVRRLRFKGPYLARVLRVLDGDTFSARIAVWPGHEVVTLVRLRGIDTPEMKGRCRRENRLAREAKKTLSEILRSGAVSLRDIGTGKYAGRIIARVYVTPVRSTAAEDAGAMLLAGGYARRYTRGKRGGWCDRNSVFRQR